VQSCSLGNTENLTGNGWNPLRVCILLLKPVFIYIQIIINIIIISHFSLLGGKSATLAQIPSALDITSQLSLVK